MNSVEPLPVALTPALPSFARALWGLELRVQPLPAEPTASGEPRIRPRFFDTDLWVPTADARLNGDSSYQLAAVAHAAAHIAFGGARFPLGQLKPLQVALVSLIEDARIERLAITQYPGLSRLWSPFHAPTQLAAKTAPSLMARLALALHDEAYADEDAWVRKGRELFTRHRKELADPALSRRVGTALGNDLGQMRVQFNPKDYAVEPAYRDDHSGLWDFPHDPSADVDEQKVEGARRVEDLTREARNEPTRQARESVQAALESEARPARADAPSEAPETEAAEARYPEWDYAIARERPAFCRVRERVPAASDPNQVEATLAKYSAARHHLTRRASLLAEPRPRWLRRMLDGDQLDLSAAIASVVAQRSNVPPDLRVYRKQRFLRDPPALLVLLDLSESLNAVPVGSSTSLLELAQTATLLLTSSAERLSRDLAVHGFSSNTRHDVGYYRFKDFDESFTGSVRARVAGMHASLSTRLGAALRHAGCTLGQRSARRKIVLVVSDGEPSDIDVHDSKYLVFDAKHAILRNRERGIASFCLGLDPNAEPSVKRIFGAGNYVLLDRLERLPEQLSRLYAHLATSSR